VIPRRRRRDRFGWSKAHRDQLMSGWDYLNQAWRGGKWRSFDATDYPPQVCDEMLECWKECGDDLLVQAKPGTRPWGWWLFDSPARREEDIEETRQLFQMGELIPDETEAVRQEAIKADAEMHRMMWHNSHKFRRTWRFWTFVTSEDRDHSMFESSQLIRMGVLTAGEQRILDEPRMATLGHLGDWCDRVFIHIEQPERELLGLDNEAARRWDAECEREATELAAQ